MHVAPGLLGAGMSAVGHLSAASYPPLPPTSVDPFTRALASHFPHSCPLCAELKAALPLLRHGWPDQGAESSLIIWLSLVLLGKHI